VQLSVSAAHLPQARQHRTEMLSEQRPQLLAALFIQLLETAHESHRGIHMPELEALAGAPGHEPHQGNIDAQGEH